MQTHYSETYANGHLYSETTCIKRPLRDVSKESAQYILTCIQRPPLYKGHYDVALAWPFNTGFAVPDFNSEKGPGPLKICNILRIKSVKEIVPRCMH